MDEREGLTKRQKTLAVVLRCFGCLDVLALVVVFLPQRWIETTAVSLGLTPFPTDPTAQYSIRYLHQVTSTECTKPQVTIAAGVIKMMTRGRWWRDGLLSQSWLLPVGHLVQLRSPCWWVGLTQRMPYPRRISLAELPACARNFRRVSTALPARL